MEKDIAEDLGMNRGTLHNYVTAQCARFGLDTCEAPTALWYAFGSYRPLLNSTSSQCHIGVGCHRESYRGLPDAPL